MREVNSLSLSPFFELQEGVGPEGDGAAGGATQAARERRPVKGASPEGDQVEAGSEADPPESEGGVGAH